MKRTKKVLILAVILLCAKQTSAQCLPIPNDDTRALLWTLVENKPFGQQTLLDLEVTLRQYRIALTPPNAVGERTKIGDPISGRWTRLGFGEGHWVWIVQGDVYQPSPCEVGPPAPPPAPPPPSIDLSGLEAQIALLTVKLDQHIVTEEAHWASAKDKYERAMKAIGKFGLQYVLPGLAAYFAGTAK